ncbi:Lipase-like PAD4 [Quillaja saponaria]|uniref:Lipase-like PAD4 n=1 Tax=Quillaja saponaria TaxID=32244 RepID=A0AAD7PIN7_QUISA|nr:Lipase-like PAD4 [Quillaja saponaria]
MDAEASLFETSEMLATLLASTPLLLDSWRVCSVANTIAPWSFVTERIGNVGYVAFSGIQMVGAGSSDSNPCAGNLVPLIFPAGDQIFTPALNQDSKEGEVPVMVHGGMLQLFLSIFNSSSFKHQMLAIMEHTKSVVITGHSIGGTTASLCALWLLSYLQANSSSSTSVLCITFGSPLLGNESLSKAILRERWGGNFCHVVSKHDIMPRLLFAPVETLTPQLHFLQQFWYSSMTSQNYGSLALQIPEQEKAKLFASVMAYLDVAAKNGEGYVPSLFQPFGSYLFVSEEGAVCVDGAATVIKMMHLMFVTSSPSFCIEDHVNYGNYVNKVCMQFMKQRNFMEGSIPESSYEAGVELALQSSGITSQELLATSAKECLRMGRRIGRTPALNAAYLAIRLSKINPYRAQIEWYKKTCDDSDDQMGYYDSFKLRGTSKRDLHVNMNRYKLARFWNSVLEMLENNKLPYNFHKQAKWVNASQFYKLLVEPLDIAEYYRKGEHRSKGHYINHGRERRYEIFDRWWRDKHVGEEQNTRRTKFASLTQDTCFWARVEEARDWLDIVRSESDINKLSLIWENIENFERYTRQMIENMEVSEDVLAKNSSYSMLVEELKVLKELRSQVQNFPQFPRCLDGGVVP